MKEEDQAWGTTYPSLPHVKIIGVNNRSIEDIISDVLAWTGFQLTERRAEEVAEEAGMYLGRIAISPPAEVAEQNRRYNRYKTEQLQQEIAETLEGTEYQALYTIGSGHGY
ncbi:hypothetical protein [Rhizobium terrae]|uniref:hypothetical protein n=1 Tax=Rhizobium terrae TaxID=2171756 RepID=UPI0013C2CCC9|nr:hypothetical protein [Rhizobium terrae]